MARYVLMSLALAAAAFAQAQQPVAPNHDKEAPESAEHKYARQKRDQATTRIAELEAEFEAITAEITELDRSRPGGAPEALMDKMRAIAKAHDQIAEELPTLGSRLKRADDCVAVYKKTIDEKVSDLTNRESEQIKACKAIDLYPPEK